MDDPLPFERHTSQQLDEGEAILIIANDVLLLIAAAGYVINPAGICVTEGATQRRGREETST